MDLKQKITEFIEDNELQEALDELKQVEMSVNQKDNVLLLQQTLKKITTDEQINLDNPENIRVRQLRLSKSILKITDRILSGEPEEKPKESIQTLLTKTPSKQVKIGLFILTLFTAIPHMQ